MGVLAILMNLAAFGLCIVFFVTADLDYSQNQDNLFFVIVLLVVAIVNSFNIVWKSRFIKWSTLYFKRKAAEEQKKIDDLQEKTK